MDGEHQLFYGCFELHRDDALGDQLRRLRADDMYAENLAVLRIGDDLYKAVVRVEDGAFELPTKGNLPTFTWKPFSLACASVRPTLPICGSQ